MHKAICRTALTAALSLGLLAGTARTARADDLAGVAVVAGLAFIAADVIFFAYDSKVVADGQLPSKGWAIAETVVAAPQTVLANGLFIVLAADDGSPAATSAILLPIGLTSMNVHGVWATATTHVKPSALYGYSPLIGANVALSAAAAGRAFKGHLGSRAFGVVETILTAPQVALGGVQMFNDPPNRNIWIAHTAWTGTLLIHGIASIVLGQVHDDAPPAAAPAPPPAPGPAPAPEDDENRPPLKVPYPYPAPSFHVGPGVVTDGVARAPGVMVTGLF